MTEKLTCEKCSEFDKSGMIGMYCNRYKVSLFLRYGKNIVQPCKPCVIGEIFKSIDKEAAKKLSDLPNRTEGVGKENVFVHPKGPAKKLGKQLQDIIDRRGAGKKEDLIRYRFFTISFYIKRFLRSWQPASMEMHTMDGRFPDKKRTVKMLMSALNVSKSKRIKIFIIKELTKVDYTHFAGLDQPDL